MDHNILLIFLSIILAVAAGYYTIDLPVDFIDITKKQRALYLATKSFIFGTGLWASNFAAIASHPSYEDINYNLAVIAFALPLSILLSAPALYLIYKSTKSRTAWIAGASFLWANMLISHQMSIYSISTQPAIMYMPVHTVAALAVTFTASVFAAKKISAYLAHPHPHAYWARIIAITILSSTITITHYLTHAATIFTPSQTTSINALLGINSATLWQIVTIIFLGVVGLSLLLSWLIADANNKIMPSSKLSSGMIITVAATLMPIYSLQNLNTENIKGELILLSLGNEIRREISIAKINIDVLLLHHTGASLQNDVFPHIDRTIELLSRAAKSDANTYSQSIMMFNPHIIQNLNNLNSTLDKLGTRTDYWRYRAQDLLHSKEEFKSFTSLIYTADAISHDLVYNSRELIKEQETLIRFINILIIISFATLLGLIAIIFRRSHKLIELKNAELEQIIQTRTHELMLTLNDNQNQLALLSESKSRAELLNIALTQLRDADKILRTQGLRKFFESIIYSVMSITNARYGAVGIFNDSGVMIDFIHAGVSDEQEKLIGKLPDGKGLLSGLYHENKSVRINKISSDPRSVGFPAHHPVMTSLLGIPVSVHGITHSVIYLAEKIGGDAFTEDDEIVLNMYINDISYLLEMDDLLNVLKKSNGDLQEERKQQQTLITKLQETQNQLLQSEKMASIGQLAAGVAHEINNPVGFVYSNLSSLQRYIDDLFSLFNAYEDSEPLLQSNPESWAKIEAIKSRIDFAYLKQDIQALLNESQEGTIRVKQIVQDLKDFSHVDEAEWQFTDLHKGIDSTLNIVRNEIKYKADITKDYGSLPPVECLPSQINQVFMNILVNAAHAIKNRGIITIRTGVQDERVWVEISDTGKGIKAEHLSRIFDPFFTTKPVGQGTGLGLSLAYSIINKHGGTIEVQSTVGQGTTFKIWLPIQAKKDQTSLAASAS